MAKKSMSLGLALICAMAFAAPAMAICIEPVGCSNTKRYNSKHLTKLKCGDLWYLRNAILSDYNYCFKSPRGIKKFGNAGCLYHDIADLPFNSFERYNLDAIRKFERVKRC